MDNSKPVSEESKRKLSSDLRLNLEVTNEQLDLLRAQIKGLDELTDELGSNQLPSPSQIIQMRRIYEYTMLIGLISSDLAVVFRVYLRAEDPYEVQYASKQIVVILTEGFKQIYNFISENDKGDLVTTNRNKSIWKKDIGKIVRENLQILQDEYNDITADLESFDDADLKAMHKPRNIFVHYDSKPYRAYDELVALHIEKVTRKALPFLAILQRMMTFSFKMTAGYLEVIVQKTKDAFAQHKRILEKMKEDSKDIPEAVKIIEAGLDNLARLKADHDKKQGMDG